MASIGDMLKNPKQRKRILIGGAAGGLLLLLFVYLRNKNSSSSSQQGSASATDAAAIDPNTGLPYASELASLQQNGYSSGIDPNTGIPYSEELSAAGYGSGAGGGGGVSSPGNTTASGPFSLGNVDPGSSTGLTYAQEIAGLFPSSESTSAPTPAAASPAPVTINLTSTPGGTAGNGATTAAAPNTPSRSPSQPPGPTGFTDAATTPIATQIADVKSGLNTPNQLGAQAAKVYAAGDTTEAQYEHGAAVKAGAG